MKKLATKIESEVAQIIHSVVEVAKVQYLTKSCSSK